jgi:hypothetical protein
MLSGGAMPLLRHVIVAWYSEQAQLCKKSRCINLLKPTGYVMHQQV